MARARSAQSATIGAVEHGNAVVLATVASDGKLLDRRTVELTQGLSTHPYHHEGAWAVGRYLDSPWARATTIEEALALIQRVHAAAEVGAHQQLERLVGEVAVPVAAIAIRACPSLPATLLERIQDNRVQVVADSVMYRQALAAAGEARGWRVHWYERDAVQQDAASRLPERDLEAWLVETGRRVGPPWQARHRLAATAAIAAAD